MKRVLIGAAATAVAATAAVLVPQVAGATGSGGGSTTEIVINSRADYDNAGATLDLGGQAKCKGTANQGAITGFDYSAFGIPAAPGSSDTLGMRLRANVPGGDAASEERQALTP